MTAIIIEGIRFPTPSQTEMALEYGLQQMKELGRGLHLRLIDVRGRAYTIPGVDREGLIREVEHHLLLVSSTPMELRS
ncbi:hypothetical protein [Marinobacter similis]|uniref:Uncharacterized protein n=1 Tax=Marinobacter similis TaxID=1420916 RepID=W5YM55_9GAMM|nr:hypothetical protein [Marinobacter similis]AHI30292.1 hypothetical protein AU14_17635 [Marinobacter similis]